MAVAAAAAAAVVMAAAGRAPQPVRRWLQCGREQVQTLGLAASEAVLHSRCHWVSHHDLRHRPSACYAVGEALAPQLERKPAAGCQGRCHDHDHHEAAHHPPLPLDAAGCVHDPPAPSVLHSGEAALRPEALAAVAPGRQDDVHHGDLEATSVELVADPSVEASVPYEVVRVHGVLAMALGEETAPCEEVRVHGVLAMALGEETVPCEEVTAPYEEETVPCEEETVPYEEETAPYEEETAPCVGVIAAAGLPAVGHPGKAAATGRAGHARHPEAAIDDHHAVVRVTTEDWSHVVHPGHRADAADRMAAVATAAGAPSVAAAGGSTCGCARVQGVARHGGRSQAEISCLLLLSCSAPGHSTTQPWQVHRP